MAKKNAALADPSGLDPFDSADKQMLRVVIETPKGSRNKFAFNADDHIFELKKVLPAGMAFPYDFGFVPSTEADDGDPVDVLVLMDEPAFPGCVLKCRPIGVIQGEQGDKKKKIRNDRIIAVEKDAHSWADIRTIGLILLGLPAKQYAEANAKHDGRGTPPNPSEIGGNDKLSHHFAIGRHRHDYRHQRRCDQSVENGGPVERLYRIDV